MKQEDSNITQVARVLGKRGGKATRELYGKLHYREMQKLSVKARKANQGKTVLDKR